MPKFDIEFEVTQRFLYSTTIEAETAEKAIEKLKTMKEYESDEEVMLDSWDDLETAKVVGQRVFGLDESSHRIPLS